MIRYRSSIYTVPAGTVPVWEHNVPHFGWKYVTKESLPIPADATYPARHVIHCAPGTEPPKNALQVIVRGHVTPWSAEEVAGTWPNHGYVMEAAWPIVEGRITRGKIVEIPAGVTPTARNLVPHEWAGDGQ